MEYDEVKNILLDLKNSEHKERNFKNFRWCIGFLFVIVTIAIIFYYLSDGIKLGFSNEKLVIYIATLALLLNILSLIINLMFIDDSSKNKCIDRLMFYSMINVLNSFNNPNKQLNEKLAETIVSDFKKYIKIR